MTDDALREEHRAYLVAPWTWRSYVRRTTHYTDARGNEVKFPKWAKDILQTLSDRASEDGTDVRPGLPLLAADAETSYERAQDAVRLAVRVGLLFLAFPGNKRKGWADHYWLVAHPQLLDRVRMETPDQLKLRAERIRLERQGQVSKARAKKATAVTESDTAPAFEGQVDPQIDVVEADIRGSARPSNAKSVEGPLDPLNPGIEGPLGPQDGGLEGPVGPPTSSLQGDHTHNHTTPSDELGVSGPVTVRAREADAKTPSIPSSMPAEGGSPYDRRALAARLDAARAKHGRRANSRTTNAGPTASDRAEAALEALGAALTRITPPATPA